MKKLDKYQAKRNFNKTKEPKGKIEKSTKKLKFCIQHHLARKDHYDLRLEYKGVMLSWAVPKGPSYNPKDKRLAVHVEDHPLSYRSFEGTIPKGEYGGGTVMLWDYGYYEILVMNDKLIKFKAMGQRFKGLWTLVYFKEDNWLLIKDDDYYTNYWNIDVFKRSVKTNRTMKEIEENIKLVKRSDSKEEIICSYVKITNPNKIVYKKGNITKLDIVNYYLDIAPKMLPYLENRLISTIRAPEGLDKDKFFKKHLENYNKHLGKVMVKGDDYYYITDTYGLISEVQMNSFEFHLWGSFASSINKPNMLVFDLDPDEGLPINKLRDGVRDLKKILDELNLKSYLKTSGGKGYHIVVPIKDVSWKNFSKIASDIAAFLVSKYPNKYTTNMRKTMRKNKIFIDWFRNKLGATSVAPYSLRLKDNAPISWPIAWSDLDNIKPNQVTIRNYKKYLKKRNPWLGFPN